MTACRNVLAFAIESGPHTASIVVNGQPISIPAQAAAAGDPLLTFARSGPSELFSCVAEAPGCDVGAGELRKVPGLQGPMDDAFMSPFLVVMPDSAGAGSAVDRWVQSEMYHFLDRWAGLFRGKVSEAMNNYCETSQLSAHSLTDLALL
eukprot:SAG22_NODE_9999_length_559_cov_0.884783_1_plen_148_part_10